MYNEKTAILLMLQNIHFSIVKKHSVKGSDSHFTFKNAERVITCHRRRHAAYRALDNLSSILKTLLKLQFVSK